MVSVCSAYWLCLGAAWVGAAAGAAVAWANTRSAEARRAATAAAGRKAAVGLQAAGWAGSDALRLCAVALPELRLIEGWGGAGAGARAPLQRQSPPSPSHGRQQRAGRLGRDGTLHLLGAGRGGGHSGRHWQSSTRIRPRESPCSGARCSDSNPGWNAPACKAACGLKPPLDASSAAVCCQLHRPDAHCNLRRSRLATNLQAVQGSDRSPASTPTNRACVSPLTRRSLKQGWRSVQ